MKKGEKGILILAPIVRRKAENDDEREESTSIAGFRAAYVFDVSQTDGEELPQIAIVQGDPRQYGERLRTSAHAQGISIEYSSDIAPACDYIQLWNGDAQLLTESLGHVRQAASQMLTALTDS